VPKADAPDLHVANPHVAMAHRSELS